MKNLFNALLSTILIILYFTIVYSSDKQFESIEYNNTIVVEKQDDIILGKTMFLQISKDTVKQIRVYEIFYNKYNVGDTIKYNMKDSI